MCVVLAYTHSMQTHAHIILIHGMTNKVSLNTEKHRVRKRDIDNT